MTSTVSPMITEPENICQGDILVVDDSPDNLRVLSDRLTSIGYRVRCVTNGEMALVSINAYRPNLVLLDIRMPVLDGYAVCQRIKSNPKTRDIPVIFLSAIDNVANKVKAFEMGGADYVTKPFQAEEILARIANQLTIQRLQHQLELQNHQLQKEIDAHKQTEAALQDAKEAAEIANHAKSNFIANMSHELRTPLNAILGFSELMIHDSSLTEEHRDYILSINQSAQNLLKTVNRILKITKVDASEISLNNSTFDLRYFLESVVLDCQVQANQKGLDLNFVWNDQVPNYIRLDDGKLRQVLTQLLKNAIQFTAAGQVSLRVNMEDGGFKHPLNLSEQRSIATFPLFFDIEDTGSGISHYEVNPLFQTFSQPELGQNSDQSVGLGLYISQQYIQAMGGQVNMSSTRGKGTRVRFYIPAQPAAMPQPDLGLKIDDVVGKSLSENADRALPMSLAEIEELMQAALTCGLSLDWVTQLNKAAIQGFDHQVERLIQEIPGIYLPLRKALSEWNQHFQFDQIIQITQHVLDQRS